MRIPSFKGLTIKVTLISCLMFASVLFLIFMAQFSFIHNEQKQFFGENAKKFFSAFATSDVISLIRNIDNSEKENPNLLSSFGGNNHTFAESMIFRNSDRSFVFPEIVEYMNFGEELQPKEIEKMFSLSENMIHTMRIAWTNFFLYRMNFAEYSVFYYGYAVSFYYYYYALFLDIGILMILILLSFFGVSWYFSQLVVRPIREQNITLSMYNHNLAHEIKTPLAVIKSNLDMFEITKNQDFINSSREELGHIENITDSLLFLADTKSNEENLIEANILEIIDDILPRFPFLNFEKKFPKNPIFARIDIRLFMILIKNIIENASKYASNKNVKIIVQKKYIIFENAITKTMIPKELQKIEEIFYQADNSRWNEGYGLGIPIMRKICEVFGWEMKISSHDQKFEVKIFLK